MNRDLERAHVEQIMERSMKIQAEIYGMDLGVPKEIVILLVTNTQQTIDDCVMLLSLLE